MNILAKQHQRTWERQTTEHQAITQAAIDSFSVVPSSAFSCADRIAKVRVTAKVMRAWSLKVNRQSFPKNMTMKDQAVRLKAAAATRSFASASFLGLVLLLTW